METHWARVKSAFLELVETGGDIDTVEPDLRTEVQELLAIHGQAGDFLEEPAPIVAARWLREADVPSRLGVWEIRRFVARSSMSVVYEASRADDVFQKKAALKVLRPGVFSGSMRARFEQERQILANLDHPHIVRVLDGGITPDGRPYLVQDFVEGKPLTRHAADAGLDLQARLRLFKRLCEAVEYVHLRGVVHRDIKPSNVLVTGAGEPKLLDFGIAKLLDPGESGPQTGADTRLYTPGYASPEQIRGEPVTAATDIFSLGVVLCELVGGRKPLLLDGLDGQPRHAFARAVLDDEPDLRALPRGLRRIAGKALAKDPRQRYASAAALREDLGRFLGGRRIVAPRRWRGVRWAAVAVAVTMLLGGGAISWIKKRPVEPMTPVLLTSDPGSEGMGGLSPDGRRVVYTGRRQERGPDGVLIKDIATGSVTKIASLEGIKAKWSPDGRWIAVVHKAKVVDFELTLVDSTSGHQRSLGAIAGIALSWFPDGKRVAITNRETGQKPFRVEAVSVDSRDREAITQPVEGTWGDVECAIAPDGKTVAVVRYSSKGDGDIYVGSLFARSLRRMTWLQSWILGLEWMPDTPEILFSTNRMGFPHGLWRMSVTTGSIKGVDLLPTSLPANYPSVVRLEGTNHNRLAFESISIGMNLKHWNRAEQDPTQKSYAPSSMAESWPDFSPDGNHVVFLSDRYSSPGLWSCEYPTCVKERRITSTSLYSAVTPRWSPDGTRIAFVSQTGDGPHLQLVDSRGGAPFRVTSDAAEEGSPHWSRDGKWLYFRSLRSGTPRIWRISAEGGGRPQIVTSEPAVEAQEGDGGVLYFVRSPDAAALWRRTPDGAESEVGGSPLVRSETWRIVGNRIYFVSIDSKLRRKQDQSVPIRAFDPVTGASEVVGWSFKPGDGALVTGFAASAGGRAFIWTEMKSTRDLMLIEGFR